MMPMRAMTPAESLLGGFIKSWFSGSSVNYRFARVNEIVVPAQRIFGRKKTVAVVSVGNVDVDRQLAVANTLAVKTTTPKINEVKDSLGRQNQRYTEAKTALRACVDRAAGPSMPLFVNYDDSKHNDCLRNLGKARLEWTGAYREALWVISEYHSSTIMSMTAARLFGVDVTDWAVLHCLHAAPNDTDRQNFCKIVSKWDADRAAFIKEASKALGFNADGSKAEATQPTKTPTSLASAAPQQSLPNSGFDAAVAKVMETARAAALERQSQELVLLAMARVRFGPLGRSGAQQTTPPRRTDVVKTAPPALLRAYDSKLGRYQPPANSGMIVGDIYTDPLDGSRYHKRASGSKLLERGTRLRASRFPRISEVFSRFRNMEINNSQIRGRVVVAMASAPPSSAPPSDHRATASASTTTSAADGSDASSVTSLGISGEAAVRLLLSHLERPIQNAEARHLFRLLTEYGILTSTIVSDMLSPPTDSDVKRGTLLDTITSQGILDALNACGYTAVVVDNRPGSAPRLFLASRPPLKTPDPGATAGMTGVESRISQYEKAVIVLVRDHQSGRIGLVGYAADDRDADIQLVFRGVPQQNMNSVRGSNLPSLESILAMLGLSGLTAHDRAESNRNRRARAQKSGATGGAWPVSGGGGGSVDPNTFYERMLVNLQA